MADVKPIPDGYHSLTPYLIVDGAAAAIDYYKQAFGATELFRMADAIRAIPALARFSFRLHNRWTAGPQNSSTVRAFSAAGRSRILPSESWASSVSTSRRSSGSVSASTPTPCSRAKW